MKPEISPRRILVVRLDNIGDVILLTPALRAVRRAFPAARITLLASPAGAQAAPLLPWVDDVIPLSAIWQQVLSSGQVDISTEYSLIDQIRFGKFDLSLIFTSFSQSPFPPGMVCMLAGVPIRAGQSKEFGGGVLTHIFPAAEDRVHQAERNLYLLEQLEIPLAGQALEIAIPGWAQNQANQLLDQNGIQLTEPYLVIAAGASCSARRYPIDRFIETIHLINEHFDLPIVLIGSPREEKYLGSLIDLAERNAKVTSLIGKTTIPELAGVINRSALVIANNSSSLHIADALRKPNVIIYSGTELISQWAPRSSRSIIIHRPTECSPCYQFECPYHLECLDIAPWQVTRAVQQLIEYPGDRSTANLEIFQSN